MDETLICCRTLSNHQSSIQSINQSTNLIEHYKKSAGIIFKLIVFIVSTCINNMSGRSCHWRDNIRV